MEKTLKDIAQKYDCIYREDDRTYDLTHDIRNLPLKTVKLSKQTPDYKLVITCRSLWGTSNGPSILSGNTSDQYRCQIFCRSVKTKSIPEFHIMANDTLRKWLFGRDLKIRCKESMFRKYLRHNHAIQSLYALSRNSAEISPIITSRLENGQTEVEIIFHSFEFNERIIEISMDFCIEMMNFKY